MDSLHIVNVEMCIHQSNPSTTWKLHTETFNFVLKFLLSQQSEAQHVGTLICVLEEGWS